LLRFKAEDRALRPLRVADHDLRVPRIRDPHRAQRHPQVEEVVSRVRIWWMLPELKNRRSDLKAMFAQTSTGAALENFDAQNSSLCVRSPLKHETASN
jgi:hypothetical protein